MRRVRLPIRQWDAIIYGSLKKPYSEYSPEAPAGPGNLFSFFSRSWSKVGFFLILSLSIPQSFVFPKPVLPSLRDFNGLNLNFFNEETGRRFLKIGYQKAISEKKKFGFLRMNLSFLKVSNLNIEMDSRHTNSSKILELFQKVSQKRGVRYAVAEPINLTIKTPNSQIRITGAKGKFSPNGMLKVFGNVCITLGETELRTSNLSLSTDEENNSIVLSPEGGPAIVSIPLDNRNTTFSTSGKYPDSDKQSTPELRQ